MKCRRILSIKNGFNYRELGGYRTVDGNVVRCHKLLRTAHLASLDEEGREQLFKYGIRTVIDFRSTSEVAIYPDQIASEFKYIHIPVFDKDVTESTDDVRNTRAYFSSSPRAGYDRMLRVYRLLIISRTSQQAYSKFMRLMVLAGLNGGVLFHCSAGKDRTGIASMLMLGSLGVPEDTIYSDYLLTNDASVDRVKARLAYAKKLGGSTNYLHSIYDLSTVNEDYYDQARGLLDYEYGGIDQYLKWTLGLEPAVINQLRKIYLE